MCFWWFLLLFSGQVISDDFPIAIAFWQHDGKDVLGNAEVLGEVEYAITQVGRDPNKDGGESIVRRVKIDLGLDWEGILRGHGVPDETIRTLLVHYRVDVITDLIDPAPFAGQYLLWCRVADLSENWSFWTQAEKPIEVLDVIPPNPPQAVGYYGIGHGW